MLFDPGSEPVWRFLSRKGTNLASSTANKFSRRHTIADGGWLYGFNKEVLAWYEDQIFLISQPVQGQHEPS
jgi:hypothetical protein